MEFQPSDIEYINGQLAFLAQAKDRLHKEESGRTRNDFQRDYSRIIYSSSFRRLQGKMQLLAVNSMNFHRNRLTHSYEVAQIARSIAEEINEQPGLSLPIPLYVVEAAALAHDIGNPPFGHYGEKILDTLANGIGGFEGNAQTLRVIMNLEQKNPNMSGLNLTLRTILATTKYFNRGSGFKKFIYEENYDSIQEAVSGTNICPRTIEAQIMDLSDEIAYAAHDLEDALSQRFFTVDDLLFEFRNDSKFNPIAGEFEALIEKSKITAFKCKGKSSDSFNFYLTRELMSNIVHTLTNDIGLCATTVAHREKTGSTQEFELNYRSLGLLAEGLKMLTFNCLKRSDTVQLYEKQGEVIIKKLFDVYMNTNYNRHCDLLPPEHRPASPNPSEAELKRCTIDYISSMMDSYAISAYEKFYGKGSSQLRYDKDVF